jgi:hypothetical protein
MSTDYTFGGSDVSGSLFIWTEPTNPLYNGDPGWTFQVCPPDHFGAGGFMKEGDCIVECKTRTILHAVFGNR